MLRKGLIIAGAPRRSWDLRSRMRCVLHSPVKISRDVSVFRLVDSLLSGHPLGGGKALHEWLGRSDQPPVIALYWNPDTGQLSRVSDADDAYLRTLMKVSSKPRRKLRWTRPFTTRCLRSLLLESSSADASSQGRTGRLTA